MDNEVEDIRAKVPKAGLNTTLGTLYPLFPEIWEQEEIPVDSKEVLLSVFSKNC